MGNVKYYLQPHVTEDSADHLIRLIGGQYSVLALRYPKVGCWFHWVYACKSKRLNDPHEISKEEAAMILFECVKSMETW